jgi:hypothetical protein
MGASGSGSRGPAGRYPPVVTAYGRAEAGSHGRASLRWLACVRHAVYGRPNRSGPVPYWDFELVLCAFAGASGGSGPWA